MKTTISKQQQAYINSLLDKRKQKKVVKPNMINPKDRLAEYEWQNTVGKYTDGMTYLQVEQFNNTYNNFR